MKTSYVHGYSEKEATRLADQAATLAELLHHDSLFEPGDIVLEAGCGAGAQTVILADKNPEVEFVSIDRSKASLKIARERLKNTGYPNVTFHLADLFDLPFPDESFDHVFLCFVLEHLARPEKALERLLRVLRPGGALTAIEGDHGSFYFHPETALGQKTVQCLIDIQAEMGGDANIGRKLFPLLSSAGLQQVKVSPRMVYVDSSRPQWVDGFSKKTFNAMVEGVREQVIEKGLMSEEDWDQGIRDLYRATGENGTFCYCFFKGMGVK